MRLVLAGLVLLSLSAAQDFGLGSRVDGFSLQDRTGASVVVPPPRGSITVVTFISTLCPVSQAFNDRMSGLYREYSPKGVQFLFIDSNANESAAEVAAYRERAGFPFEVFQDPGNSVADRFGAMSTPDAFVIDSSGVVRYRGFIEDSTNEARVKKRALRAALDALLAGAAVPVAETKAFGCSIKRARRSS